MDTTLSPSALRTLTLLIGLIAGAGLTACGDGGNSSVSSQEATPAEQTQHSPEVVSTMDAESGEVVFDPDGEIPDTILNATDSDEPETESDP